MPKEGSEHSKHRVLGRSWQPLLRNMRATHYTTYGMHLPCDFLGYTTRPKASGKRSKSLTNGLILGLGPGTLLHTPQYRLSRRSQSSLNFSSFWPVARTQRVKRKESSRNWDREGSLPSLYSCSNGERNRELKVNGFSPRLVYILLTITPVSNWENVLPAHVL